jgi:hypothetical protein
MPLQRQPSTMRLFMQSPRADDSGADARGSVFTPSSGRSIKPMRFDVHTSPCATGPQPFNPSTSAAFGPLAKRPGRERPAWLA